jgi:hypothetical protein
MYLVVHVSGGAVRVFYHYWFADIKKDSLSCFPVLAKPEKKGVAFMSQKIISSSPVGDNHASCAEIPLERLEVPVMTQAIEAYREVTVSPEFRELERLRELAGHNEASASAHARRKEAEKWQSVIADRDARIAELEALLGKR